MGRGEERRQSMLVEKGLMSPGVVKKLIKSKCEAKYLVS